MPRKRRTAKRRQVTPTVKECLYLYLLYSYDKAVGAATTPEDRAELEALRFFGWHSKEKQLWRAVESRAVEEWAAKFPGTRPKNWWFYSAPEVRRVVGGDFVPLQGLNRCHPTGIPYLQCTSDLHDAPMIEGTAALLDRYDLWQPGERARVDPRAFAPQRFSLDLCWGIPKYLTAARSGRGDDAA